MNILLSVLISVGIFIAWNLLMLVIKKKFPRFARAMQILSVAFVVIVGVFLVFLFLDAKDFVANFESGKKVFMLEDNSVVKSAIILQNNTPIILYQPEIDQYSAYLKDNDLALVKGDAYKLIMINMQSIEDLPDFEVKYESLTFSKEESLKILTDDAYAEYLKKEKYGSDSMYNFKSIYDMRALILSEILTKHFFSQQGQSNLVVQLKNGNVRIYPETLIFKIVKIMPSSWIPLTAEQKI